MSTAKELRAQTIKALAEQAKKLGLKGISGLKKEELVQAIVKAGRAKSSRTSSAKKPSSKKTSAKKSTGSTGKAKSSARRTASRKSPAKKTTTKKATTKKRVATSKKSSSATKNTGAKKTKPVKASKSSTVTQSTSAKKTSTSKNSPPAKKVTKSTKKTAAAKPAKKPPKAKPERKQNPEILKKLREENERREQIKDLARGSANGRLFSNASSNGEPPADKIILIVRDPFWMQAYWEVTRTTVERVQVALAEQWLNAVPTLRVLEIVEDGPAGASESVDRDIPIHGGVNNWYISANDPPKSFRVALGYKTSNDRFHLVARSNKIDLPEPGGSDAVDEHWTDIAEDYQRFFAMSGGYSEDHNNDELQEVFEKQLRRPMTAPKFTKFGVTPNGSNGELQFQVDAEMIVYGSTDPAASVVLSDEPVNIQSDGSFAVRVNMPDRRQVIPVVASSRDGTLQRTIVLAVERNTKVMEQVTREIDQTP